MSLTFARELNPKDSFALVRIPLRLLQSSGEPSDRVVSSAQALLTLPYSGSSLSAFSLPFPSTSLLAVSRCPSIDTSTFPSSSPVLEQCRPHLVSITYLGSFGALFSTSLFVAS